MSNPAKLIFTYGLVLLLYPSLQGQEKLPVPDAQAILKKTREVYSGLNSYHFVHEILVESKKQGEKAFKPIGQIQMEAASEQAAVQILHLHARPEAWLEELSLQVDPCS